MRLPAEHAERLRPAFEGTNVCVTGGAGFIGSHLIDALFALGAHITVIDDLSTSKLSHLAPLIELDPARVRFVHGSILEDAALHKAMTDAQIVFHLAALSSVPRSIDDPERSFDVNATGTLRVVRAAASVGAHRLVFAGSSSAYGDTPELPKHEAMPPSPRSPYAAAKLAGEHLVMTWARTSTLDSAVLRFFNVFGPRQPADSPYAGVVPRFAARLVAGKPPVIQGDGGQTRDFTYVENAVLALLLAGAHKDALDGQVFNVGGGERHSVADLARIMAQELNPDAPPAEHAEPRAGDVRDSHADLTRIADQLGYTPFVTFQEGVRLAAEWYRTPASTGDPQ
ncbi:MAG: NAD-dependent epimerase/dehydratase family protein [Planctomycetota bacterium]